MTKQKADFGSAQALADRARQNFEELRGFIGGDALWRIEESQSHGTAEWSYALRLNRPMLGKIERVVADCSIALMSALDHLAAALAISNGHQRIKNLYYPFAETRTGFQEALTKHKAALVGYENILTSAHAKFENDVPHVAAAKELSNTSKHWALLPPTASSHGVTWQAHGAGQRIANIPANHFATHDIFEFYRGSERLNQTPMNVVIVLSLSGMTSPITSPDMILGCALRYVEGVISEVSKNVV